MEIAVEELDVLVQPHEGLPRAEHSLSRRLFLAEEDGIVPVGGHAEFKSRQASEQTD